MTTDKLHSHPALERKLGLGDKHVIIDKHIFFRLLAQESNQVQAGVKPACGHKLTAKQFFIEQYQEGKCEDITTNPEPDFDNLFYLNIYKLMEDYSKSV